jgi:hypothetical protein
MQHKDPAVLKTLANLWSTHADIAERAASLEQAADRIGEQLDTLMADTDYTIEQVVSEALKEGPSAVA